MSSSFQDILNEILEGQKETPENFAYRSTESASNQGVEAFWKDLLSSLGMENFSESVSQRVGFQAYGVKKKTWERTLAHPLKKQTFHQTFHGSPHLKEENLRFSPSQRELWLQKRPRDQRQALTFFEAFGESLDQFSTLQTLTKSFRKLALKLHPDQFSQGKTLSSDEIKSVNQIFCRLKDSYETLKKELYSC